MDSPSFDDDHIQKGYHILYNKINEDKSIESLN